MNSSDTASFFPLHNIGRILLDGLRLSCNKYKPALSQQKSTSAAIGDNFTNPKTPLSTLQIQSTEMSDQHGAADMDAGEIDFELYRYTPSLPAAIVTVIVFAILTAVHVWRLYKARAFYFIAFTIGGVCEFPAFQKIQ